MDFLPDLQHLLQRNNQGSLAAMELTPPEKNRHSPRFSTAWGFCIYPSLY